ncbi:MAG: NAD(P)/FAD-dependent oxidoreductase [Patescibacteria group bacterium]
MGLIAVVGGGPAGMMAALAAARAGARVVLLEKNPGLGQKLLLTGNGRCNLTNQADLQTLVANMPGNGRFLHSALARFGPAELRGLLASLGVPTVVEEDGRVFPASNRARDVQAALLRALRQAGVDIRTSSPVVALHMENGCMGGVRAGGRVLACRAVILATGGLSYPETGCTGDGYRLAGAAGHRVEPPRASLVPLVTAEGWTHALPGLALDDAGLRLSIEGRALGSARDALLFTHDGVSGPAVLRLSRAAVPALAQGAVLALAIDLAPSMDLQGLDAVLRAAIAANARRGLGKALAAAGLIPASLAAALPAAIGIEPREPAGCLGRSRRLELCRALKALPLTVTGAYPLQKAVVTAGGVAVAGVDPATMASRLVPGLYFAGELLDVDGYTGGFNLQAAFSTGHAAGRAAAAHAGV